MKDHRSSVARVALMLVATAGCAGGIDDTSETESGLAATATVTIHGNVSFEASYQASSRYGQVPNGHAPLPFLYVCAWERDDHGVDSKNDFEIVFKDQGSPGLGDDLIGCADADVDGNYSISASWDYAQGPDVYLVTYLCDGPDGGENQAFGAAAAASICVRRDFVPSNGCSDCSPSQVESGDGAGTVGGWLVRLPRSRKVMWSRPYWSSLEEGVTDLRISWNLSCPDASGLGAASVTCAGSAGGPGDAANSNAGYNKESVHAFRAAVEPRKTKWELKPSAANTVVQTCTASRCLDEINLHVQSTTAGAYCVTSNSAGAGNNSHMQSYDRICLRTPLDPFRVVHEMGHIVQRRWMVMAEGNSIGAGVGSSSWQGSTCQKQSLAEGWANFFSAAAWHNEDHPSPVYDGNDIENPDDPALWSGSNPAPSCAAAQGEGRAAQFFWDLYDSRNHPGEVDQVNLSMTTMRAVWGRFSASGACVDGSRNEGGPHGRNAQDWADHYNAWRQQDSSLPSIATVLADNCMNNGDNAASSYQCSSGEGYDSCP